MIIQQKTICRTMKWINLLIKKNRRLYLIKTAFNLTPQQLHVFCTRAKTIQESRKRNMILKCLCSHVGCVAL